MAKKSKKEPIKLANRERLVQEAQQYTLFDDTFMNAALKDTAACQHVLGIITGMPNLRVVTTEVQYPLKSVSTRSAILDVLAEDSDGRFFNIELQKADTVDHAKRVRLYESLFDSSFTPKGADFGDVPDLISIYLSKTDIWKQGRTAYRVRKELDDTGLPYNDGHTIIYVNAAVDDGSEIARLMQYFLKADPTDNSQGDLSRRVKYLKLEEGGRDKMCDIAKKYYNDGKAEAQYAMFCKFVTKYGMSFPDALAEADVPAENHARFVELFKEMTDEE